tara:strand:- start:4614 stop:5603 length:990 start_codon:yes stop_codon:yes gene_type:complete
MKIGTIWALTDGKAGMVNQARGLASAIAREFCGNVIEKVIVPRAPWSLLPAGIWPPGITGTGHGSDDITAPWPRIVVSCGRHAIGPAIWIKRKNAGRTAIVHAQYPRTAAHQFDVIVAQSHDALDGANVITVLGSMHSITDASLAAARQKWVGQFEALPRPLVAVLIGGTNKTYHMTADITRQIANDLLRLKATSGCGLLVTASRRTGEENLVTLRDMLSQPGIYYWEGGGENPYKAFLEAADAFLVSADSINMISEACFTGKPVYILPIEGGAGSKFERFHRELSEAGHTRMFAGDLEDWSPVRLDQTTFAAREIFIRLSGDGSTQVK